MSFLSSLDLILLEKEDHTFVSECLRDVCSMSKFQKKSQPAKKAWQEDLTRDFQEGMWKAFSVKIKYHLALTFNKHKVFKEKITIYITFFRTD